MYNINISKTTAHKYLNKELKLSSIARVKRLNYKKGKPHKIFENLLNQNFYVSEPNRIWCTDFTYLKLTDGSFRYNCSILDLYDRSIVSSITAKEMTSDLAIKTLERAFLLIIETSIKYFLLLDSCVTILLYHYKDIANHTGKLLEDRTKDMVAKEVTEDTLAAIRNNKNIIIGEEGKKLAESIPKNRREYKGYGISAGFSLSTPKGGAGGSLMHGISVDEKFYPRGGRNSWKSK